LAVHPVFPDPEVLTYSVVLVLRELVVERLAIKAEDARRLRPVAARGFQTRAAGRLDGLQTALMAEQDPSKRAAIVRQIQELSVKADKQDARMEVVRGSVDPMTGKRDGDYAVIFDPSTQTARQVPVGGAQAQQGALPKVATPQDLAALKSGTRFVDSNGVERIKK
jgi:hypothetical protein